ncbi:hypothetical protein EV196_106159 [Mariniflexile fucanivorans]|uniref:Uncharacterized protein n=1 Tax=Mariniflexile fucanivorans TaxID=264023 RepID=A0A4R1RG41_9FLAO|nr:hypothetical protein [Mariniflexile fucanivorans]TCL64968.1 hypothetical protein EV196_106159 [Mariniflexile fucanivorans]
MKNIIYACLFLFTGSIWAQEKPKNISEESTIKTVKTNDGSGIVEKKIKVTTRSEQGIEFDEQDENKRDKNVIDSPVKVKKTIEVDNDIGSSYDSKTEIGYYQFDGKQYGFKKVDNGFSVLLNDDDSPSGNIVKFNKENHYIYQNGNDTGIGYFNEDGSFTIEYYDQNTRKVISQDFILQQK